MAFLLPLLSVLNPVSAIEQIKDENQKRRLITLGVGLVWSQYITLIYSLGNSLTGKMIFGVLAPALRAMSASALKLLNDEQEEKIVLLAVPKALVGDTDLLESIQFVSRGEKGK